MLCVKIAVNFRKYILISEKEVQNNIFIIADFLIFIIHNCKALPRVFHYI